MMPLCTVASSVKEGKDGYNIALFELKDAEVLNCAPYQVESIDVNYKEFGNRWFARRDSPHDEEDSGDA